MIINQRDIIEVPFLNAGPHPAIVVSTPEILIAEGFFYAVLMSTKNIFPEFTYPVVPDMINNPRNHRKGFVLCHQMLTFYEDEVIRKDGSSIKLPYFREIVSHINLVIFDIDKKLLNS